MGIQVSMWLCFIIMVVVVRSSSGGSSSSSSSSSRRRRRHKNKNNSTNDSNNNSNNDLIGFLSLRRRSSCKLQEHGVEITQTRVHIAGIICISWSHMRKRILYSRMDFARFVSWAMSRRQLQDSQDRDFWARSSIDDFKAF